MAKQPKLRYRFFNPNTVETTAEYIASVLVESNRAKIESLLREATPPQQNSNKSEDVAK